MTPCLLPRGYTYNRCDMESKDVFIHYLYDEGWWFPYLIIRIGGEVHCSYITLMGHTRF